MSYNVCKLEPKFISHKFPGFLNGLPTSSFAASCGNDISAVPYCADGLEQYNCRQKLLNSEVSSE